ncbi:SGNH/GDSL hydrolase family protein [Klebsiella pneumoniae]|uniref:SGNH/GDSL hydrolase family protein n=3 Tax=Klebsiella pneumoniae TaxID=573 RepID=UPI001F05147E|nr:SGNH/GDSL hydrolase family protein [Klebsiella pneumoniae]MCH0712206.1 SGNH/GDSL hydrolase family protein [Klebsiella pneumoniae]HDO7166457.1 SGNH/GDSL hydrolase family protein [Klebsiella pneumoniae]
MALTLLATNNAESTLASAISATDTSLIVSAGTGAEFPDAVAGESYFKLTLTDAATGSQVEIVNVTAKAGDIFTIERAQEGTLARAWAANDMVANMMTADTLNVIADFAKQASDSAEEAQGYALSASEFGDNKSTFADTSAGLAATTSGQYFRVPQGTGNVLAFRYYKNNSGVAQEVAEYPGQGSITNTIREFPTLAAAQADADAGNIPVGSTAYYRSSGDDDLSVEVINNAGTLEPTGRKMPSQASVDAASEKATLALESVPVERVLPELVPVVQDSVGKVALWLEDGDLNGKGVSREFADKSAAASSIVTGISEMVPSESVTPQLVPVVQDAEGKVSIWLENGDLAVKGVSDDTSDKVATSGTILPEKVAMLPSEEVAPSLIPLVQDIDGNVALWLENGDFVARGLGSSLIDIISAALSGVFQNPLKYTDARTAWRWRTAKSKYKLSVTSKLKVGFTGDSWTEKKAIPQMMANILYSEYSKAGEGWINFASANGDTLNGMSFNISGWTTYDASETTVAPTYGCALDGLCLYATGTAARITLNSVSATGLSIYYKDTLGTFRYTIDGGTPVVVAGAGAGTVTKVDITGLSSTGTHQLVIDLTGNADTVVIYGVYATISSNGVEIQKFGNANITADGYTKVLSYIPYFAQQLNPDIIFMIIGTNDYRLGRTLSNFYTALTSWVQTYKTALPDTCLVLIAPPQCNATGSYPLTSYRDIMRKVATENNCEFFSLYDDFPSSYATANSYGLWNDALHLNNNGADFLSRELYKYFL